MHLPKVGLVGGLTLAGLSLAVPAQADPCLLNDSDVVSASLSADVGDFTALGIVAGDGTGGTACIEAGLWTNPAGFGLGSYLGGAEFAGHGVNNTVLGSYVIDPIGTAAAAANSLDFFWVQDSDAGVADADGNPANGNQLGNTPGDGLHWDLGGAANQVAVFVFVDHGPLPGEVLENTAWLSNDLLSWSLASLTHVYGAGWSPDPNISDGFVAVYTAPNPLDTFRYVSVTWGGPGALLRDGDNEIDAVGGLTAGGGGVFPVPEPTGLLLMTTGVAAMLFRRRLRQPS
jgi:hypothetical protein